MKFIHGWEILPEFLEEYRKIHRELRLIRQTYQSEREINLTGDYAKEFKCDHFQGKAEIHSNESINSIGRGNLDQDSVLALLELQTLFVGPLKRTFIRNQIEILREEIELQKTGEKTKKLSQILQQKRTQLEFEYFRTGHGCLNKFSSEWLEKAGKFLQALEE